MRKRVQERLTAALRADSMVKEWHYPKNKMISVQKYDESNSDGCKPMKASFVDARRKELK